MGSANRRLPWNTRFGCAYSTPKTSNNNNNPNLIPNTDLTSWGKDAEVILTKEGEWFSLEYTGTETGWISTGSIVDMPVGSYYTVTAELKGGTQPKFLVQMGTGNDWDGSGQVDYSAVKVSGTGAATVAIAPRGGVQINGLLEDELIEVSFTRRIAVGNDEGITQGEVSLRPGLFEQARGTTLVRKIKLEEGMVFTGW